MFCSFLTIYNPLLRNLCITPPFARLLRQAQISFLEILQCIPVVEIIAFLVLGQNWMFFKGLVKDIKFAA